MSRLAVFVDRDGVINELVPDRVTGRPESPLSLEDVTLVDGAANALRDLAASGHLLVGVSNQPAAAKGLISLAALEAIHARVVALVAVEGVQFDDFQLCFHHPEGVVPELSGPCRCRKPAPGMLLEAARGLGVDLTRSWMIGDTDADTAAGRAAGCRTILVESAGSAHKRAGIDDPDARAADLVAAAVIVLRAEE